MIKSVTVINFKGESITIELARPELSGFAITSIDGLGPGKSTINVRDYSMLDGGLYTSSRMDKRNITLTIKYLWAKTIEEARLKSYKYFPLKKPITLIIETERRKAQITGYVESNEPDIFSNDESTNISIVCPDPYFYSTGRGGIQESVFYGAESLFEFPFCNDSLTDSELIFSNILNTPQRSILYTGDADTGITISIHAIGYARNIKIYNTGTDSIMLINTELTTDDTVIICTDRGNKYIYLMRQGQRFNLINSLGKNSSWLQLVSGENTIGYTAESGVNNLLFKIENRIPYEGV